MPNNCITLVGNGKHILHFNNIKLLSTTDIKNKKLVIILNTKRSDDTTNTAGHWIVLLINKQKKCLFIDSLNKGKTTPASNEVINTVKTFCIKHNLHFINWKTRSQCRLSQACGFIILFYINLFAKHGIPAFEKLKKMFLNYSIHKREYYVLKKVFQLCIT